MDELITDELLSGLKISELVKKDFCELCCGSYGGGKARYEDPDED